MMKLIIVPTLIIRRPTDHSISPALTTFHSAYIYFVLYFFQIIPSLPCRNVVLCCGQLQVSYIKEKDSDGKRLPD